MCGWHRPHMAGPTWGVASSHRMEPRSLCCDLCSYALGGGHGTPRRVRAVVMLPASRVTYSAGLLRIAASGAASTLTAAGFGPLCPLLSAVSAIPAEEAMGLLHLLFSRLDELSQRHGIYKIETIGDSYGTSLGFSVY